ncbi:hypothetical protein PENSPDRAFT_68598 [Peniophora sp. CONT]|nr:hypothetical protein PENSPDRAFT_68598 [Peniophora sp. CONT]
MADPNDSALVWSHLIGVNSIITLTFGLERARERFVRFMRQAYTKYTGQGGTLPAATFFDLCLSIPGLEDPTHVWFSFWEGIDLHYTAPYWINVPLTTGGLQPARYHLLAINTLRPDLIIPSHLCIPYENTARSAQELEQTWMLPTYFASPDGGVGIRLATGEQGLLHLSDEPTEFDRQTVYVHLHLRNYTYRSKQIRLRNTDQDPRASTRQLARRIAAAVRFTITNLVAGDVELGMEQWRFGTGEGLIGIDDIILLGFVHVSQGKITPLLGLREDFQFPGAIAG